MEKMPTVADSNLAVDSKQTVFKVYVCNFNRDKH